MFEKNLESIDNPSLKRRLSRISQTESKAGIAFCITPSNDYVLLKDEVALDDLTNPREAIRKMIDKTIKQEMTKNDTIITFGIGLGYLLDEVFNKFPSKIYIYEPDINLLHFVLSNVDISEHLSSGRVFISNELSEITSKLSSTFLTKDKVEILYLQNYAVLKNKELLMLTQKVFDTCKSKMVDINTITKFSKNWLINSINNISYIQNNNVNLLSSLENKFQGQTALIAGAGPSLNDNIDKIAKNRDKFVIFAVNKVVKYLLQNGITPDFVVCLDAKNMNKTLGGLGEQFNRANCIIDIRTDSAITQMDFNHIFVNFAETDFFIKKIFKNNNFLKFYESGGSASTLALTAAVKMGFSKIVLSGIDLAFKDNVIYSDGQTMNRISQEQILVDNTKKNIIQVKSVTGSNVYTREDYQAFIHHFSVLIKELGHKEIYNTSSFGAYIEGTKNATFDELPLFEKASLQQVAFVEPFKFELKDFMQEEFFNINQVIAMLSKGIFSPVLITAITKSIFLYQYMQADILEVLQKNFASELAEDFIQKTKNSIKVVVETLQKTKLI